MGDLTEILLGCSDFGRLLENFLHEPTASTGGASAAVHRLARPSLEQALPIWSNRRKSWPKAREGLPPATFVVLPMHGEASHSFSIVFRQEALPACVWKRRLYGTNVQF